MQSPKPYHEVRPWGEELWLTREMDEPSMVKIITVNPGEALSLQFHHNRDEYWAVVSGDGTAEVGADKVPLQKGVTCFVPRETKHRISGGKTTLIFVEMAFGEFDEKDIVRLEDRYGRIAENIDKPTHEN